MNIKELLLIVCLALVTTWGLEYLFFSKKSTQPTAIQSGQSFVVPKEQHPDLLKPLVTDIDFIETKKHTTPFLTEVDTPLMHAVFSTDGASLERLEFKKSLVVYPMPFQLFSLYRPTIVKNAAF